MTAPQVPETFPPYLVAGATWQWRQRLYDQATGDEFLADDGGTVTMYLTGHYSLEFTATADTDDDVWDFSVASGTTNDITPASKADQVYRWRILGVLDSITYDLGSGSIFVYANPDITAGDDRRTHAQKMVPLIQAELEARLGGTAGSGHNRYSVHGRSMEKFTLLELQNLLGYYESRLERDTRGRPRPFRTYFGRARG
jgi:hypothetical protein